MAKKKRFKKGWQIFTGIAVAGLLAILGHSIYQAWLEKQANFVRYDAFGIEIPKEYSIHGIDVSKYQQMINWESVKEMQVEDVQIGFAFIKATEGNTNVDKWFKRNWRKAKQTELTRGAYHFFLATKSGKAQAENFISRVDLEPGDLPPVLDVEQTYGVSDVMLKKRVKEWLETVEAHYGVQPIIYTNVEFYRRHLGDEFDDYPLWVAHYLQKRRPRIHRDWHFWQHSETGRVNGIASRVDFNVFNGDSTDFYKILIR
jgi:lysozyme